MVRSWYDVWCRLGALGSSMKYHVFIVASTALFMGALTGAEWLVVAAVVLGGRIAQNMRRAQDTSSES